MQVDDRSVEPNTERASKKWVRWARIIAIGVACAGLVMALLIIPRWLMVITPRWVVRGTVITLLWTLFGIYWIAIPAVVVGLIGATFAVRKARRQRNRDSLRWGLRVLLLSSTCLLGLVAIETGSAIKTRLSRRLPKLPTKFPATASSSALSDAGLYLVVIGESSARGEPYHPWLSVGQIVGWQLEKVFPGRKVRVDVRAEGGLCLEQAILLLQDLNRRPDSIMLFSGHNEFITRLGPTRNVRHYVEEGPLSQLALIDLARSRSATAKLILGTLDTYYGERSPPLSSSRAFVDHPAHTPEEFRFLCEDFSMRLDAFARYCNEIRALPILIMPGSNDGSFEPNRSVLNGSTAADDRSAFEQAFRAAQAYEAIDPPKAITGYRKLAEQHPEFAETHYRLAQLLASAGDWDDAKKHFVLARDLDGFLLRCPTALHETYRAVARRHDALLIDSPQVLERSSPHGTLDDFLFHDAQHPNLRGIVALANEALAQLKARRAFGWPESIAAPQVDIEECARHFNIDARKWSEVCRRSASFYFRTATVRFDPSDRERVRADYEQAATAIGARHAPLESNNPNIGLAAQIAELMNADGHQKSGTPPSSGDED